MNVRTYNAETDLPFVMRSWMKSFQASRAVVHVHPEIFYTEQRQVIASLLKSATTLVVCDPEATDVIWGWACGAESLIHFIFVKQDFRRMGIGRHLASAVSQVPVLEAANRIEFSHWPPPVPRSEMLEKFHQHRRDAREARGDPQVPRVAHRGGWLCEYLEGPGKHPFSYNPWKAVAR